MFSTLWTKKVAKKERTKPVQTPVHREGTEVDVGYVGGWPKTIYSASLARCRAQSLLPNWSSWEIRLFSHFLIQGFGSGHEEKIHKTKF